MGLYGTRIMIYSNQMTDAGWLYVTLHLKELLYYSYVGTLKSRMWTSAHGEGFIS